MHQKKVYTYKLARLSNSMGGQFRMGQNLESSENFLVVGDCRVHLHFINPRVPNQVLNVYSYKNKLYKEGVYLNT